MWKQLDAFMHAPVDTGVFGPGVNKKHPGGCLTLRCLQSVQDIIVYHNTALAPFCKISVWPHGLLQDSASAEKTS
jgi:hypothetical protein